MNDETKIAHLKKLCSAERTALTVPFLVTIDGDSWSMSSDGKMLFAWHGKIEGVEERKDAPRIPKEWIAKALAASKATTAEALRAWAGAATFPSMQACTACKGTGTATEGHNCNCEYCEADEKITVDCFDCDGEKEVLTEDVREGVIAAAVVNRNYFAMLLEGIDGPVCVDVGIDKFDQILMRGDDWFGIVMPMNRDRVEAEKVGTAPVLSL